MTAAREWTTIDKTTWPAGPWHSEPDKRQWVDEDTGLDCLIVRNPWGALCGYVGVPPGHPWYGVGSDAVTPHPDVHGNLTHSGHCQDGDEATTICHVPEPGRPEDVWWLGFDCAHGGDLCPGGGLPPMVHDRYRDVAYVASECRRLAAQAQDAA